MMNVTPQLVRNQRLVFGQIRHVYCYGRPTRPSAKTSGKPMLPCTSLNTTAQNTSVFGIVGRQELETGYLLYVVRVFPPEKRSGLPAMQPRDINFLAIQVNLLTTN